MSIGHRTKYWKWGAVANLRLLAAVVIALPFQPARADGDSVFGDLWAAYGIVNYSSWDGLGDVEPIGRGGPFETKGFGLDLGAYMTVARTKSAWILAGGEVGFLGLNSDVIFEQDPGSAKAESAFEVNHLTALIKVRFGEPGSRYLDLGAGLGAYLSDTKYIDCSVILSCFRADTGNTAAGAFLDVSGSPGLGFLFGARVHFVEFDPIEAVDLGVRKLSGPIYSIYFGWEYSKWRRRPSD